jgi:hypothetical protein
MDALSKIILKIKNDLQNILRNFFVSEVFNKNVIFNVLLMIIDVFIKQIFRAKEEALVEIWDIVSMYVRILTSTGPDNAM